MKNRVMTLGEISVFIRNGATIKQNNQEKNGYPITRIETISDGTIDQNRMGYAGIFEKEKYRNWFLENEDILISHINSEKHLGKSAIYFGDKEKIIHGMNLLCFRTKKEIVISSYLYFYFKSLKYKKNIGKIAKKSVNQASFSIKDFRDIEINLPDIENQKKIVEKLKTIYEILKLKEEQVKKLSELSKCLFFEMFGDPILNEKKFKAGKIRDIVSEVKYGTSKSANKGGKYPYLRMNNITYSGELNLKDLKYIDLDEKEKEKYLVHKGELLFNRTNSKELVGKTCVFNIDIPMVIAGYIIKIKVNEKVIPEYISAILNSTYGKNILKGMCKSIIGQANINAQELQEINILIPSIELQNKFAERIKLIEKSKFIFFKKYKFLGVEKVS